MYDNSVIDERIMKLLRGAEREIAESLGGDDDYVDPLEPYFDMGGEVWRSIPGEGVSGTASPVFNEQMLGAIRNSSRALVLGNEFAINAIENRINYIVGKGHRYHTVPKADSDIELSRRVQDVMGEFLERNEWNSRQQEMSRRRDRDGEVFVRIFVDHRGRTAIRFVEPSQVYTPQELDNDSCNSFGIHTVPEDVETVLGYWIDGKYVGSSEIQHRKANVDRNVKRGIPLLYPVRKNLRRAEKLLRNMSVVAEIQSAIALIRKHGTGNGDSIRRYVQGQSERSGYDPMKGRGKLHQRFEPGTIIDAYGGTDYEFPVSAIDASRYVLVLQAELRAIAARLVMPEFMLSSDASNANYSSTMVAEGPAVRMFERMQHEMIYDDLRLLDVVICNAIHAGELPWDVRKRVSIHAVPPIIAVRDRLKEAQADEILVRHGVLSRHTMAMRYGLDPENERNLECHCCDDNGMKGDCSCSKD